jgi:uncharacterized protein YndB with AHSA1/START domain
VSAASDYTFVTTWIIPASLDRVWAELMAPETWPKWWYGLKKISLVTPGDAGGVGAVRDMTWRSVLPYRLTFQMRTTAIDPKRSITGVSTGELEGTGVWTLEATGPTETRVRYDWRVTATKSWMRTFAPLARPLFAWNHNILMDWGRSGLIVRLGGKP